MESDLLARRETRFVLWRPKHDDPPPYRVIGQVGGGNPPMFEEQQSRLSSDGVNV